MKTIPFSGFILLILILTGCSEKMHELSVDTSNGKTTFNGSKTSSNPISQNNSQYIRKGKAFTIKMSNISPNDSLVLSVSEQDIRITGDDPTHFTDEFNKTKLNTPNSNPSVESEIKKQEDILNTFKNQNTENKRINEPNQKKEQRKLDSLHFVAAINYTQNELHQLLDKKNLIKNESQKSMFLNLLASSKGVCSQQSNSLSKKEIEFPVLSAELKNLLNFFDALKSDVENLVFEREQVFFPSKEEFTVSVKKYNRNSKSGKAEELVQLTFIQYKRFKIFSSIGAHCMIYNGKYAGLYDNKDSVIVRRNGSNIIPSIGTYLNGTWRLNDCLMGIGLGIGIPLQLTNNVDMTPNFNVLWTTNFQNQYGRFGVNAGFGIQKVNVLSPGFNVGDNLGTTNLDVPLRAIWTPTFGVGISYNIGERE